MCWFITIGIPKASQQLLERVRDEHRALDFQFLDSTPTTKLFGPGQSCAEITFGGCSCDLVFHPGSDPDDALAEHERRLRKKGLSESKVRQALEAKAHALTKPRRDPASRPAFNAVIARLVQLGAAPQVFSHYYSGNQHAQAVPPPDTATISVEILQSRGFAPDTIVTVRSEA